MTYIYALAQQKGGVGKTTTVINLGGALADRGKKVLLVDLDPQGALTAGENPPAISQTINDILSNTHIGLDAVVRPTFLGADLAPANIDLAAAEIGLTSELGQERIPAEKLAPVVEGYDAVLIDCPPSLGLLTLNALTAATDRTIHSREVLEELRGTYGQQVCKTVIPQTIKIAEAQAAAQSIHRFAAASPASEAYRQLSWEVMDV